MRESVAMTATTSTSSTGLGVRARYADAQALLAGGHFDQASTELVWLWKHILDHEPSAVGVRVSFLASMLEVLASKPMPCSRRRGS
jgi:hypothetical protein